MEESDDQGSVFGSAFPPARVSLTPFTPSVSPSPRRLSSCLTQPSKPVRAKRQLAWVSLQGRLVGAKEATAAKTIDRNGLFSAKEAAAWELFTPIQRVLVVAIVAAAAFNSKKNKQIVKLQKSVELRDHVLLSMQQKLDNLCQKVNSFKDQPESVDASVRKMTDCCCKPCQHHKLPQYDVLENTSPEASNGDEVFKYKISLANVVEPEERRVSDLSDWAPSVASSADIRLDNIALENDINSLQKECEEKDVAIKKLSDSIQSYEGFQSKRIAELEDIICRKNMVIKKLRKDILVLEHKVMNLTRLQRSSFSPTSSTLKPFPIMADNVLYDMDSTTSPSSSDSDSSHKIQTQCPPSQSHEISVQINKRASKGDRRYGEIKSSKLKERHKKPSATSPLKERSLNQTPNSAPSLMPKYTSNGENRTRRRPPVRSKEVTTPKRWI
ncbi:hypothetical protein CDL12_08358 [Handroanthus impetiginosus]|uniref:Uncharacterized protein n=1 Tax=Handroanthus impetiginosus TaxID=429701 RepID=A0A2G9HN52_9LAMI|nr:hypothetical protein CDL12_08358 [Handroanthus impetiginosus]